MLFLKRIFLPPKDHLTLKEYTPDNHLKIEKCLFCQKKLVKVISLTNKISEYSTSYCKNCDFITKGNVAKKKYLDNWFKTNWYKKHIIRSKKRITPDFKIYSIFKSKLKKDSKIIDLGCGNGNTVLGFQKKGFNVKGLEPSKGLVGAAKKYTKNIQIGGYEKVKKIKGKFDLIIFNDVLQFLANPKHAIDIAINKLNTNGYLYIKFGPLESKNIIHFAFLNVNQNILTTNTILKNYNKFEISVTNQNPVEIILRKKILKKQINKLNKKNLNLKYRILKDLRFLSIFFLKFAVVKWSQRKIIFSSKSRILHFPIKIYFNKKIKLFFK